MINFKRMQYVNVYCKFKGSTHWDVLVWKCISFYLIKINLTSCLVSTTWLGKYFCTSDHTAKVMFYQYFCLVFQCKCLQIIKSSHIYLRFARYCLFSREIDPKKQVYYYNNATVLRQICQIKMFKTTDWYLF